MASTTTPLDQEQQEDLLYGDLEDTAVLAKSSETVRPSKKQKPSHVDNDILQEQVQALQLENETLKRNMGILFRTAKIEIRRKNEEIHSLQSQLDALQQQQHNQGRNET